MAGSVVHTGRLGLCGHRSCRSITSDRADPDCRPYKMITTQKDLLRKYDVPGPRYTSYPVILHWDAQPTVAEWIQSITANLSEKSGAAIYVHIPFCRSLCTYCGCNSRITCNTSLGSAYVGTLLREWELYREAL